MRNQPRNPRRFTAAVLAIAVHIALALFLIFGVRWQNRNAEPMEVEVVQSSPPARPVLPPAPEPEPPRPVPPPMVPPPTPAPPPKPEPAPAPPPLKQAPPVARPEPPKADIALKARQEKERLDRQREQERSARELRETAKKENERRDRELREAAKLEMEKRERTVREAEKREIDRRNQEELKVAQARALQEAEDRQRREAQVRQEREERERKAAATAASAAAAAALARSNADYVRRIEGKVRGNVILPPDIPGNPEGAFEVVQLPTGEIISAEIRKSSGSRAYDDAVLRAILKSSPLPKPDREELFQRSLILRFRPRE